MLTRSGVTRLVDGLVGPGLIERVSCESDARVSYAQLTDAGYEKLRQAGCTHVAGSSAFSCVLLRRRAGSSSPACSAAFQAPRGRRLTAGETDGAACTVARQPTGALRRRLTARASEPTSGAPSARVVSSRST